MPQAVHFRETFVLISGYLVVIQQQMYNQFDIFSNNHLIVTVKPRRYETCKRSINGTMDLLLEPPMLWIRYYTYMTFNITEIEDYQPKPQPPTKVYIPNKATATY